jgi:hypothetical protein
MRRPQGTGRRPQGSAKEDKLGEKQMERQAEDRAIGESLTDEAVFSLSEEDDARFREAVQIGIEQAERGEFIEEEEMDARVARMLRGKE